MTRPLWTTRRWLTAGVVGAVLVLIVLTGIVVATLQHGSEVTNRLVDRIYPAQTAAIQLEASLVDQETGVRGYGLTGQKDFLQPYILGIGEQQRARDTLLTLTAGDRQERADLAAVQAQAAAWQARYASPIAAAAPGAPAAGAIQRADEGKTLFDGVRAATQAQQADLRQATIAGHAELVHVRNVRNVVFGAIGATILLLFLLAFEGLRRGVDRPLASLSTDTRRIAAGEFGRGVTLTGPADLRNLAGDIEAMRRRLVAELAAVDEARAALDVQAQELRRSNNELEQFAYVASHDLQEPLRKVASFCQLLQRRYAEQLDERANQYIGIAVDGAERMQKLITDLLTFSRAGRQDQDLELVDLAGCVDEAVDNLQAAIGESDARIEYEGLPVVLGDATQLTLLVQNLLSNAIKFRSPERAVRVRVSARRDGEAWHLAVTDNGIGIEPEFGERVFLIFQRLHSKGAYPGSGIGLALCRKIVEFHGGEIRVDTAFRGGTRIAFTLPVVEEAVSASGAGVSVAEAVAG